MEIYNPNIDVNSDEWLELDEKVRLSLVEEYHREAELDLDDSGFNMHCAIHVVVENQLALGCEYVPETLAKLLRQGLERHESIHAIGAIIVEDIYDLLSGNSHEFSPKKYRRKLQKITAKRWLKGQY